MAGEILGITGHRPDKLGGWHRNPVHDLVKMGIRQKLTEKQPSILITGMALGTDQWAAEICIELKIPFAAFMPYRDFGSNWPESSKAHLAWLLTKAAQVLYVTDNYGYTNLKLQKRNMWLVDSCQILLAVYNGTPGGTRNCIGYATKVGKPIEYIDCMAAPPVVAHQQRSNIISQLMERQAQEAADAKGEPEIVRPKVSRIIEGD